MIEIYTLEKRCSYTTNRLLVKSWKYQVADPSNEKNFAERVISLLTEAVTKSLPDGWQGIDDVNKASDWIKKRAEEGAFLTVQLLPTLQVEGFLFLSEADTVGDLGELRLGYLLSESVWGKGLGSELIRGLVEWCEMHHDIQSLSGGVASDNIGSIKVLEKNGFSPVQSNDQHGNMIFLERRFSHQHSGR